MLPLLATAWASPCSDAIEVDLHTLVVDLDKRVSSERWVVKPNEGACPNGLELPDDLVDASTGPTKDGVIEVTRTRRSPKVACASTRSTRRLASCLDRLIGRPPRC